MKKFKIFILLFFVLINFSFAYNLKVKKEILPSGKELKAYIIYKDKNYNKNKFTIYINASIHGNEVAPNLAVKDFLNRKIFSKYLDKFNFIINPLVNPDGFSLFQRRNIKGYDLNRDYITLLNNETKFIVFLLNKYKPDLVIDMHEAKKRKVNFLYSIANNRYVIYSVKLFNSIIINKFVKDLKSKGYSVKIYTPYKNKNIKGGHVSGLILRNYAALRGSLSILFETSTLYSLEFRKELQLNALNTLLNIVYNNLNKVKKLANLENEDKNSFFIIDRNFQEIEHILKAHNIYYYKLKKAIYCNVISYKLLNYKIKKYYNDLNLNIKVKKLNKRILVKKGDYIIPLNVKDRGLVIFILSPLSKENIINLHLLHIPLKKGIILPIYYVKGGKI